MKGAPEVAEPVPTRALVLSSSMDLDRFPGGDLVVKGLADLATAAERETMEALLVSVGAHRLRRAGLDVPETAPDPEHRLYRLLASQDPDTAHSRYNALIRRLVSFERALECAA